MSKKGKDREYEDGPADQQKPADRHRGRKNKRPLDYRQFASMDPAEIMAVVAADENEE